MKNAKQTATTPAPAQAAPAEQTTATQPPTAQAAPAESNDVKRIANKTGLSEQAIIDALNKKPVPITVVQAIAEQTGIPYIVTIHSIPEQIPEAEGKHEPTFKESEVERIIHRILKHVIAEAVAIVKDPEDFLDLVNTISYLWNYDSVEFGKDKQYRAVKTIEEK